MILKPRALGLLVVFGALSLAHTGFAQEMQAAEQSQRAELEQLRTRVAGEVQLAAYDLLDELVYQWTQSPPFSQKTPVFVADVTVPVGMGTGLGGLLENHLATLLIANPSTQVKLSHCPACNAVITHSGPEGTVISRGVDNPEALKRFAGEGKRYGLYIDFAAEGAWLVLRARITELTPDLPIVWSRTLSSAVGTPSLLRHPKGLKSASEAREEYLDALNDRSPYVVPIRFAVRTYAAGTDSNVTPPPVIWLQTGVEVALTQARAWTASVLVGYAWLPQAYEGFMVQGRLSRLLSGPTRSLTGPDVYLFFGGAVMTLEGPAVSPFQNFDTDLLLQTLGEDAPIRTAFAAIHLGVELRMGNRIGTSFFLETMPAFSNSTNIGEFFQNDVIDFHSFGAEVTFCF
ncbi:MAG: hypothetical protein ACE366_03885 [Bradymonadia bacterium]